MGLRLRPFLVAAYLLAGLLAEGFHAHGTERPSGDAPAIHADGRVDRAAERCSSCEYLLSAQATPTVPSGPRDADVEDAFVLRFATTPVVARPRAASRAPPASV